MGRVKKRAFIIFFLFSASFVFTGCSFLSDITELLFIDSESTRYTDKIINAFEIADEISVGEVFDFRFSKAYVFSDGYMSGDAFAKEYDLDISITEVKERDTDTCGRIVFVDENGDFVFLFTYNRNVVSFEKFGQIIYPHTKISKCNNSQGDCLKLSLNSDDYYYNLRESEKYTTALLNYWKSDKTVRAQNIFYFGYSVFCRAEVLKSEEKIIFYDEEDIVMYEYTYDSTKILFEKTGITIYPDMFVKKCGENEFGIPIVGFSR